jgi:hypothetical protein
MFTEQELQQLAYFLSKSTLNGGESLAHAQLLIKINQLGQELAARKEQESS